MAGYDIHHISASKLTLELGAQTDDTDAMAPRLTAWIVGGLVALGLAGPAAAGRVIYSYDSTTPVTETMTESGITLIIDKGLMHARVLSLSETMNVGNADLKPAAEGDLGKGGLNALIGRDAQERTLYEILPRGDGKALIRALCPGANKGWLAFGVVKVAEDLRIRAIGRDETTGQTHLCLTLDYAFHGQWDLPPVDLPQPDRSDPFEQSRANTRY